MFKKLQNEQSGPLINGFSIAIISALKSFTRGLKMCNATTMHRMEELVEDLDSVRFPYGSSEYGRSSRHCAVVKDQRRRKAKFTYNTARLVLQDHGFS